MITILGPTASGKTHLAVNLAYELDAQIISADSRQVYQGMDIGTGKDLNEYEINGKKIIYHLIDILPAGAEYNVFRFQDDFLQLYKQLSSEKMILCGGTGLYLDAVLKAYHLIKVPIDPIFHQKYEEKSIKTLITELENIRKTHNTTDFKNKKRLIRALEIAIFEEQNKKLKNDFPIIENTVFGISIERSILKERINKRLDERLNTGMIEEVENLMKQGITLEKLLYYGLEYKFIGQYLQKELTYEKMHNLLQIGIHQYSKKQMTWFRRMEKQGIKIHWIDGLLPTNEKIEFIKEKLKV